MSGKKKTKGTAKKNKDTKNDFNTSNLFEEGDEIQLPYENPYTVSRRDFISKVVNFMWDAMQDWASAWKEGKAHLKKIIPLIMSMNEKQKFITEAQIFGRKLAESLTEMEESLKHQHKCIEGIKLELKRKDSDEPVFTTIKLDDYWFVFDKIIRSYEAETSLKSACCKMLPIIDMDTDMLNMLLARWSHHSFLSSQTLINLRLLLKEVSPSSSPLSNKYFPCKKCSYLLPYYTLFDHAKSCHEEGSSLFTHPYIAENHMLAEVKFMKSPKFKKSKRKSEKSKSKTTSPLMYADEPDWLKTYSSCLEYKTVLVSPFDLIRCSIDAYSCVQIGDEEVTEIFVTFPYEDMKVGTIAIYDEGFFSMDAKLLKVEKVPKMDVAEKATFLIDSQCNISNIEDIHLLLSQKLKSLFDFGFDSTFILQEETKIDLQFNGNKLSACLIGKSSKYDPLINDLNNLTLSDSENNKTSGASIFTSTPKRGICDKSDMPMKPTSLNVNDPSFDRLVRMDSSTEIEIKYRKFDDDNSFCSSTTKATIPTKSAVENKSKISIEGFENLSYINNEVFDSLKNAILFHLKSKNSKETSFGGWGGILLHGPSFSGKNLVSEVAEDLRLNLVCLTPLDLIGAEVSSKIKDSFTEATKQSPSILFLGSLDSLCPINDPTSESVVTIIKEMESLQKKGECVVLVAETSHSEFINPKLRQARRFNKDIFIKLPNNEQRFGIFSSMLNIKTNKLNEEEINELVKKTSGFTSRDLISSIKLSISSTMDAHSSLDETIGMDVTPANLNSSFSNVLTPSIKCNLNNYTGWNHIFGYDDVKLKLKSIIKNYNSTSHQNSLLGLLLFGPPGNSKTMFVRALAYESGFSFFSVKCSNLISKYVGETEKNLSKIFRRAEESSPSIIFMDEADSLCCDRESAGKGLVSELLSLMSQAKRKSNIMLVAATNRPYAIDEALLAPGCLDQLVYIPLPDCKNRCAIWKGLLKEILLSSNINIMSLCELTDGYSGAEIRHIYNEAIWKNIKNNLTDENVCSNKVLVENIDVTEDILLKTINSVASRTSKKEITKMESFLKNRNKI